MITKDDVSKIEQYHSIKNIPVGFFAFQHGWDHQIGATIDHFKYSDTEEIGPCAFDETIIVLPQCQITERGVKSGQVWACDLVYTGVVADCHYMPYGYRRFTAHPKRLLQDKWGCPETRVD